MSIPFNVPTMERLSELFCSSMDSISDAYNLFAENMGDLDLSFRSSQSNNGLTSLLSSGL